MKYLVFIYIVLFSLSIFAKETQSIVEFKSEKIKCSVENYVLCLKHENLGVVESALVNVIKFRYRCNKADFKNILKQIKVLCVQDENKNISRKAELVYQILQNPELVAEIGDNFYSEVDQYLEATLLNSRFKQELSSTMVP